MLHCEKLCESKTELSSGCAMHVGSFVSALAANYHFVKRLKQHKANMHVKQTCAAKAKLVQSLCELACEHIMYQIEENWRS